MNFVIQAVAMALLMSSTSGQTANISKDTILKKIMEKVAEGNDRISGGEESAILLVGNTGSGKSTLAHVLTGRKLQGILNDETGDMIVEAVEPLESIRISHNKCSETKIPNKCISNDPALINRCININGEVIWDCPGLNDTDIIQQIANSFYVKKVYNQHKKVKFILVASEGSLADKGTSFVNILQQFCNSFNNVDLVKDSVVLVITGAKPGKKIEHLKNTLTKILSDNESLSTDERKMLSYLINKIALFHMPSQEGLLAENNLAAIIGSMGDFADARTDIGKFSLSPQAIEYCHDLLKMSFTNLKWLVDILYEAVKNPRACTEQGSDNHLEKNYHTIKEWLPSKITYSQTNTRKTPTDNERFIKIKLLRELSLVAQNIQKIDDKNLFLVADIAEQIYNILENYAKIQSPCNNNLEEKINHFAYAVKQMKEYSHLFSSLIGNKFENGFDLVTLSTDLSGVIKKCSDILEQNLREAVINLDIDESSTDISYHQEAISILGSQPDNETCIKKQAQCNNSIGYAKKKSNEQNEAIKYYLSALKLDKTIHNTYDEIGHIFASQGKFREAITFYQVTENSIKIKACYKKLMEQNPSDYKIREEFADALLKLGMLEQAQRYYMDAKSLTRNPEVITSLLNKMTHALKNDTRNHTIELCEEKIKSSAFYNYALDLEAFKQYWHE